MTRDATDVTLSEDGLLVAVRELSKRFPLRTGEFGRARSASTEVVAVAGVTFDLAEGETFGLVGPNGAGKTTLVKLLTTLLVPSAGGARIAGLDLVRDAARIRRVVGMVTNDERSFYWRLTGRENLEFFASLYALDGDASARWIAELLELVGLSERADERVGGYSTGMKQRLAFARGLLSRPRLLLMDEPTKGVDPVSRRELLRLLKEDIRERWHPTVLVTSHDLGEVERLCERVALMHRGRFLAVGTLAELRARVPSNEPYRFAVRGLDRARLEALVREVGHLHDDPAAQRVHEAGHNGHAVLSCELDLFEDEDGLARLVRGVVEAGGDVVACVRREDTFDDVFQRLLQAEEGAR